MPDLVQWSEVQQPFGLWGDTCRAAALVGHDYGGTHARTGVFLRQQDGSWTCARAGSVRHEGQRRLIDAGVGEALAWVRRNLGATATVRLGLGCKGPTDVRSGWTDPGAHFAWGAHNVVERYAQAHANAFEHIVAANDLVTCALGAVLAEDVRRQLARELARWNSAHSDRPIPLDDLHRDVAVLSVGTGAGYKVIGRDGRIGEGGEVWTLYAPIDLDLLNWLRRRYRAEAARRDGVASRYALYTEKFVSSASLPLVYEYLTSALGETPAPGIARGIAEAPDPPAAISDAARGGCPVCARVLVYLAVHLASLCQQIVQAHRPRSLVLCGPSLLVPNWELLQAPFLRYFRREFGAGPVEFPLVVESVVGLREWMLQAAIAIDRTPHPGVVGAGYLAAHAEFYQRA
jgi:hypothetical protein